MLSGRIGLTAVAKLEISIEVSQVTVTRPQSIVSQNNVGKRGQQTTMVPSSYWPAIVRVPIAFIEASEVLWKGELERLRCLS